MAAISRTRDEIEEQIRQIQAKKAGLVKTDKTGVSLGKAGYFDREIYDSTPNRYSGYETSIAANEDADGESGDTPGAPGRTVPPSPGYKKELETVQGNLDSLRQEYDNYKDVKENIIRLLMTEIEEKITELAESNVTRANLSSQLRSMSDDVEHLKVQVRESESKREEWKAKAMRWQQKVDQLVEDHRKVCEENDHLRLLLQSFQSELGDKCKASVKEAEEAKTAGTELQQKDLGKERVVVDQATLIRNSLCSDIPLTPQSQRGKKIPEERKAYIIERFNKLGRSYIATMKETGVKRKTLQNWITALETSRKSSEVEPE